MLVSATSKLIGSPAQFSCKGLQRPRRALSTIVDHQRSALAGFGRWECNRPASRLPVRAETPGGGIGVIDRPTTATPGIADKGATKRKKPPIYRVMLHNDTFNRREYVVSVILKVVDGYTVDEAVNVMQAAHINGLACVISCSQDTAEKYCEGLRSNGLISSLEPDSGA